MNPHSEAGDSLDQIWEDIHESLSWNPFMNHIHKSLSWTSFTIQFHESESWNTFTNHIHEPYSQTIFTIHIHKSRYQLQIQSQSKITITVSDFTFTSNHNQQIQAQLTKSFICSTISKTITLHKCESLLWDQNQLLGSLTFQTFVLSQTHLSHSTFTLNTPPKHKWVMYTQNSTHRHHKLTHKQKLTRHTKLTQLTRLMKPERFEQWHT